MRRWVLVLGPLLALLTVCLVRAEVPDSLRLNVPFQPAWDAMLEVLKARDMEVEQADRAKGTVVTVYREYSSGPMTDSHISKIGVKPKLIDAEWVKVQYRFEVEIQVIEARVTVVTADAKIKALKRDFLGTQTWVEIPTNGELETDLLTGFGKQLFGERFELTKRKKGFWEREPRYVPDSEQTIPKVVGPERPTPP
ncbi:MAG: outer membrane protein assembly factor BamC [Acidobacteria bacterium]|nr:MAG: outer membrane protein assembly factor BamC [Acidobacteriota bacterium]